MPRSGRSDSSCFQPSEAFAKNRLSRGPQTDLDPCSAAVGGLHGDRAAPLLRQLANDGQAEAGPTLRCGPPSEEPIGDPVSLDRCDRGPDVLDGEEGSAVASTGLDDPGARLVSPRAVDQAAPDLVQAAMLS